MRRPYRVAIAISLIGIIFGSVAIGGGGGAGKLPIVIVIDAGHGGEDPGARGVASSIEKDITLAVARSVALQSVLYPNLHIVLTRVDDHYVELADRVARAREVHAAAYVSLHANAAADATARGVETYVAKGARDEKGSRVLAATLQREVVGVTRSKDRGVRTASLYTARATMPAALVELGFITEKTDAATLQSRVTQERIARAILDALADFVGE